MSSDIPHRTDNPAPVSYPRTTAEGAIRPMREIRNSNLSNSRRAGCLRTRPGYQFHRSATAATDKNPPSDTA